MEIYARLFVALTIGIVFGIITASAPHRKPVSPMLYHEQPARPINTAKIQDKKRPKKIYESRAYASKTDALKKLKSIKSKGVRS